MTANQVCFMRCMWKHSVGLFLCAWVSQLLSAFPLWITLSKKIATFPGKSVFHCFAIHCPCDQGSNCLLSLMKHSCITISLISLVKRKSLGAWDGWLGEINEICKSFYLIKSWLYMKIFNSRSPLGPRTAAHGYDCGHGMFGIISWSDLSLIKIID